jgi:hypothetical protein
VIEPSRTFYLILLRYLETTTDNEYKGLGAGFLSDADSDGRTGSINYMRMTSAVEHANCAMDLCSSVPALTNDN